MHEIQEKQCRDCKETKTRIQFGNFPGKVNKRWVDGDGKQWSGHRCADCQRKKALENMRKLREREDAANK